MLVRTRAIVLRTIKYGEASFVADLLTEEYGRMSFLLHIPKTGKGKVKKQFFQPLSVLELVIDYRERKNLQHIRDVRMAVQMPGIALHPVKRALALFLQEFLYYVTRSEQRNAPLFLYIVESLSWLDMAPDGYANFHLVFMLRLSRFVGFYPNLDDFVPGCLFDLREARFVRKVPLHSDFLRSDEAARLHDLFRMNYETMHLFRMNRQDRNRITELALRYYRLHVPDMPELKCLDVLKTLFD
ncbi:MAG: DNA repair protein RecO [Prevotella sp.]|nr:DNA repair protein RecO [Prevotella sp.]